METKVSNQLEELLKINETFLDDIECKIKNSSDKSITNYFKGYKNGLMINILNIKELLNKK